MQNIKKLYLYIVSVIALVIWVVGAIMLVNMALKAWVFPKADSYAYYPAQVSPEYCTSQAGQAEVMKPMPECAPGYEEQQRKMDEQNRSSQRQRDASQALSMILIAAPVWFFHWRLARKEQ